MPQYLSTMKKIHSILIIMTLSLIGFSCKKSFLDVEDNTELTRQGYVKNLNTMGEYLNGIYGLLSQYSAYGTHNIYPELVADNLKPLSSPPQNLMAQYSWSQQKAGSAGYVVAPGNTNMDAFWKSSYLIIRACNFVIEDVDKYKNENIEKANQIKGEALSLRALLHLELVNTFSQSYVFTSDASHPGVPYITASDLTIAFNRVPVSEVYNNIIVDLKNAAQLLSPSMSDRRHFTLLAAKAILARVYLFKGDFSDAKSVSQEVMEKTPLSTIGDGYPDVLFSNGSTGKTEVLFQLTPGDVINSNFMGRFLKGRNTWFLATDDIVSLLHENENDIRNRWVTNSAIGWSVSKFPSAVAQLRSLAEADYYQPVIRSSEMFLTFAEACAKTGDETNARVALDKIRQRADLSVPTTAATGAALLDSIYKERRKELAFEGLRMYDLQRWKLDVHRNDALSTDWSLLTYPSNKAIAPIPLNDVTLAGLSQNIGY